MDARLVRAEVVTIRTGATPRAIVDAASLEGR
jgi:hypothetical protein